MTTASAIGRIIELWAQPDVGNSADAGRTRVAFYGPSRSCETVVTRRALCRTFRVVPDDPTDDEVEATLAAQPTERWQELWDAVDALEAQPESATWAGGQQIDTAVVDGTERPVFQMPYVIYSDAVERVLRLLYDLDVVTPFRWPEWDGVTLYRSGRGLSEAPVADAVRLATAVVRADRFCEGTIAATIEDGTLQAILRRLRRWFDDERGHASPSGASGRGPA